MSNLIKGLVKPIRTTVIIEAFLAIFNLLTNFIFLSFLAMFFSFQTNVWTMSIADFWNLGILIFLIYVPFWFIMSIIKGFILEIIIPILMRWK